jgi:osmotically-inducible protein OsmY
MIEIVQVARRPTCGAPTRAEALASGIAEVLKSSGYAVLRSVVVEYHEGVVVLRGRVPTFYLKQVAQAVASKVRGVDVLVNRLCVDDTPRAP